MMPQSTFMIFAAVHDGQLSNLRALLATMNCSVGLVNPHNSLVPFACFNRLHTARFVILEANTADELKAYGLSPYPWRPALVFLGDCDGDAPSFLAELVSQAGQGLQQIFSFCEGYSADEDDLLAWMIAQNIRPAASYINWLGRTAIQIQEEAALHESLSKYLQEIVAEVGRENCRALRQKLLSHVEMEKACGRLTLTPEEPTPWGWRIRNFLHKIGIPLILLLLSPLFLIAAPFFAWRLRMLERSDPEIVTRPTRRHIQELSVQEDRNVCNQFNAFGDVKPGLFRLVTVKFILLLSNYAARHVFNRGFLARVRTIHFARWVLVDNNRRVLFASNYDGGHEAYMDDFINKVGWGLNLIFSNGVGYPSTRWLIKGGAEQEQKFKYVQRRKQLPSEVWYKVCPDLTAHELLRNHRIRQGVEIRQSSAAAIREWLSLI